MNGWLCIVCAQRKELLRHLGLLFFSTCFSFMKPLFYARSEYLLPLILAVSKRSDIKFKGVIWGDGQMGKQKTNVSRDEEKGRKWKLGGTRKKKKCAKERKRGGEKRKEKVLLGRRKNAKIKYQLYVARLKQARLCSLCKRVIYKWKKVVKHFMCKPYCYFGWFFVLLSLTIRT